LGEGSRVVRGLRTVNKTAWSTADLRALVAACLRARGASGPRLVTFAYRREGARRLGCADVPRGRSTMVRVGHRWVESTEGWRMRINLPRPTVAPRAGMKLPPGQGAPWLLNEPALREVVITIEHEVDHTMGLLHADMVADDSRACAWSEGLWLRLLPTTAEDPGERRARDCARLEGEIARLETRIKRLRTAISRRRRKIAALGAADTRQAARKGQST
jgi:hypothetical protein